MALPVLALVKGDKGRGTKGEGVCHGGRLGCDKLGKRTKGMKSNPKGLQMRDKQDGSLC